MRAFTVLTRSFRTLTLIARPSTPAHSDSREALLVLETGFDALAYVEHSTLAAQNNASNIPWYALSSSTPLGEDRKEQPFEIYNEEPTC